MPLNGLVFCKETIKDELPCIVIKHPKFSALLSLQGAQLLEFKPKNEPSLLWLSPEAAFKKGTSPRGGIPICWPWFGNVNKNPEQVRDHISQPELAHGFARTQTFTLATIEEHCDFVKLTLILKDTENTRSVWPFSFELKATFTLGRDIALDLSTCNTGTSPFTFTEALHSYYPTNISKTQILGNNAKPYVDALDNWKEKQEHSNLVVQKEIDRIVRHGGPYQIIESKKDKAILVESNGKDSIIWNPWIDKSKRLSQFPDNAYQSMLCIESANVLDNAISLAPGNTHNLTLRIKHI